VSWFSRDKPAPRVYEFFGEDALTLARFIDAHRNARDKNDGRNEAYVKLWSWISARHPEVLKGKWDIFEGYPIRVAEDI